jgi:hypothetical protein
MRLFKNVQTNIRENRLNAIDKKMEEATDVIYKNMNLVDQFHKEYEGTKFTDIPTSHIEGIIEIKDYIEKVTEKLEKLIAKKITLRAGKFLGIIWLS